MARLDVRQALVRRHQLPSRPRRQIAVGKGRRHKAVLLGKLRQLGREAPHRRLVFRPAVMGNKPSEPDMAELRQPSGAVERMEPGPRERRCIPDVM